MTFSLPARALRHLSQRRRQAPCLGHQERLQVRGGVQWALPDEEWVPRSAQEMHAWSSRHLALQTGPGREELRRKTRWAMGGEE